MSDKINKVLAIIPARGGSKGVPRKNIRLLDGKPLIAHTIEVARQCPSITRCILSTDAPEIAQIAQSHGIDVPFMRPDHLATDHAATIDVVLHAVERMEKVEEMTFDVILLLQPTTPLRIVADVEQSLQLLQQSGADSVVSFYPVERGHPYYMYTLDTGEPHPLMQIPDHITRRQEFPSVYVRNGAIYATKRDVLVQTHSFYGAKTQAYIMPYERSINIDSEIDLLLAEQIIQQSRG